jgi:hypothetical protein
MPLSDKLHRPPLSVCQRLAWLLACIGIGAGVGFLGSFFTGNPGWYFAIPIAVAAAWLFIADPSACERPAPNPGHTPPGKHKPP